MNDIFAIFDKQKACSSFFWKLNVQHLDIKFIVEQKTTALLFLDFEIKVTDNKINKWVWRKPTNTGLLLNFLALCPKNWKKELIQCLLHRAKIIDSTKLFF